MTIIDGTNLIMGRASTVIAKRLLKREKIDLINAEKMVITGNKVSILEKYNTRLSLHEKGNPHKGPKYSRMPDKMVRRSIRGMLPWKRSTGREAFKNLKVHIGVPEALASGKTEKIELAQNKHEKGFALVGDISKNLGAKW